jgi:hypothetical protein
MRVIFLAIFAMIVLASCDTDQNRSFKSAGEEKTEKYDLEQFDKVVIRSDFDIQFDYSEEYSVTLICGKNLIPYILHDVKNRELILQDDNGADWLRKRIKPRIIISCPSLKEISVFEACDLSSLDTIHYDNLSLQCWAGILTTDLLLSGDSLFFRCHATTGDYKLRGNSNYAYMYNVGSGYIKARTFYCNTIYAVHSSLGDSELNASQLLMIEKIEYGRLFSFSELCPIINDNDTDWGDLFVNLGCQ